MFRHLKDITPVTTSHGVGQKRVLLTSVIEDSRNKLYPMLFKQNRKTLVWGTEDWTVSGVPNSESSCLIPAAIADYDLVPVHHTVKVMEAFINNKKSIGKTVKDFFHLFSN